MEIQDLFVKYAVMFGRRYKLSEKKSFLTAIQHDFQKLGYSSKALMSTSKRRKYINLYVGDVNEANIIFITHYDTPTRIFFRKTTFYPFNSADMYFSNLAQSYLPIVVCMVVGIILLVFGVSHWQRSFLSLWSIVYLMGIITLAILSVFFAVGTGNFNNFNMNSASLVSCISLAEKLFDKEKKKVAFILTDDECFSHQGDLMVQEALPTTLKNKHIIHLRCIGFGTDVIFASKSINTNFAKDLASHYKGEKKSHVIELNDNQAKLMSLNYYPKAISISTAKSYKNSWVVYNTQTNKDVEVDAQNVEWIRDCCLEYIRKKNYS